MEYKANNILPDDEAKNSSAQNLGKRNDSAWIHQLTYQESGISLDSLDSYMYNINASGGEHLNYSDDIYNYDDSPSFFDTYFSPSRFTVETVFACTSAILNAAALVLVARTKGFSPYHVLFINLVAANTVSCILSWLTNNALYLFEEGLTDLVLKEGNFCKFFVYLLTGVFSSSSFSIVSLLTVLGFLTVQYLAKLLPLQQTVLVRKRKVVKFIICTWGVTVVLSCIPFTVLLIITYRTSCTAHLLSAIIKVVIIGANCYMGIVTIIYLATVIMCVRIYFEIHLFHVRLSFFRFQRDPLVQRKIFLTSVILLGTMTFFFLPYSIIYVVTLNKNDTTSMHNNALIYYMTLLPYLKYISDPLIYGLRMNEIQRVVLRTLSRFWIFAGCACKIDPPKSRSFRRTATSLSLRPIRSSSITT